MRLKNSIAIPIFLALLCISFVILASDNFINRQVSYDVSEKSESNKGRMKGVVMHRSADIRTVLISLKVRGEMVLFILLASDGSINRMGTGSAHNIEKNLFIGQTPQPLLPSLLTEITDEMLKYMGKYDIDEKKGDPCRLTIIFKFADDSEGGFEFLYGTHSEGPPYEITSLVKKAVEITQPWYISQKRMASELPSKGK